jgi:hypothetical protein
MNSFLEFTEPVLQLTKPLLQVLPQYAQVIGLHIRHQKLGDEAANDEKAEQCIATLLSPNRTVLRGYRRTSTTNGTTRRTSTDSSLPDASSQPRPGQRRCVLLIATDRASSLARLSSFASNTLGCDVLYAGRGSNQTAEGAKAADAGLSTEHGHWPGATALADIHLLGHAHTFIGTAVSTFSQLPGSMVAAQAMRRAAMLGVGNPEPNPDPNSDPNADFNPDPNPILVLDARGQCRYDDDRVVFKATTTTRKWKKE